MILTQTIKNYQFNSVELSTPIIIAEAGVNHEGSMELAKRLIDEAQEGGANAIKFQTYKASLIASKDSPSYWDLSKEATTSQFELFQKYDSFWKNEYESLKKHCDRAGIEFLSTPFDVESAKFLNDLMDVYKISSSDLNNLPFIDYMCKFNKPIILSTGASYIWEVERTLELIKSYNLPVCLMHCVLNYPTEDKNANLGMIRQLMKRFPETVPGYSDHTLPKEMDTLVEAGLLGARIIEKHFTFDKTLPGNDHYHAMDKEDLKHFFKRFKQLEEKLGSFDKKPLASEAISRKNARRSLIARRNIPKGKVVEFEDLTWKRPAFGIAPSEIDQLIGQIAQEDLIEDTVLQWSFFRKQRD